MAARQTGHIQLHRGENTRIGPITIITLLTVVCMVVLAVLAVSTAQATTAISQRQATAAQRLYLATTGIPSSSAKQNLESLTVFSRNFRWLFSPQTVAPAG